MEIPWWWYYYVNVGGPTEVRWIGDVLYRAAILSGVLASATLIGEVLSVPGGTIKGEGFQTAMISGETFQTAGITHEVLA